MNSTVTPSPFGIYHSKSLLFSGADAGKTDAQ